MSFRTKLLLSYLAIIIFSVCSLDIFITKSSQKAVFEQVTEKSEIVSDLIVNMINSRNHLLLKKIHSDLFFAKQQLNNLGNVRINYNNTIELENCHFPSLYAGNTNLALNNIFVDNIKNSIDAISSIFLLHDNKLLRIATSISIDNKRILGTCINNDSEIYKKIIHNKSYFGKSYIINDTYITGYEPITNSDGKVIGAIALGYKQINTQLKKTLKDIIIGKTGYVYILDSSGNVILHPNIEGENLKNFDFCKEILKNKNGLIDYKYNGIHKLAAYKYYKPWDFYIVSTANYDDLYSSSRAIFNIALLIGLIVFVICIILSIILTNSFVAPIDKLKDCMKIARNGDLTVQCDLRRKDELGMLADSFNSMIDKNKRLLDEVVKCDKIKTDFISNISHEFKTPINIISSVAQLLSLYTKDDCKDIDNSTLNKYISTIRHNCYRLLKLTNNLIGISQIESGFINLHLKNENIVEIVENLTLSTVEYVKSKNRNIIFDTDIEEKIIAIDSEKIERIILNLISNAVKFTKPGDNIKISIQDKGKDIIISVLDTGIGIPENMQDKIFNRFTQVDPLFNRNHEGSGIGLYIVKSLVKMHKGSISLKSKPGKGSEFIVKLPVILIPEEKNSKSPSEFTIQSYDEKIQIEFSDL
ncbi:sensor histidine kinase TmoS [Clostridium tepidiprofundi DSM 19306]|uniref:histidine kinase n=1 Tax=Clostridium tepidiprofundi DSM 19306 TaxID=1121338 RepID=A0A151B376_9CLOT|nr:Cache 3/Cache 2 fusion domain-containing protein [Clostridium tepidiprofundi]KYH34233.1 sensor histidine kinase TmoS [Clostridium tepidiprofundi DSM 19306]